MFFAAKNSIFTHVMVLMQGLVTIKALNARDILMEEFDKLQSKNCVAFYLKGLIMTIGAVGTDIICMLYTTVILLFFYFMPFGIKDISFHVLYLLLDKF